MRHLEPWIVRDLEKKMVFIGGPRQCGKTTMAQDILKKPAFAKGLYFNWDSDEDRRDILSKKWSDEHRLLIFDELHKYPKWKNWVKGLYDTSKTKHQILVTGSARLDVYRRGGDSLLGRYHYWRLHPFTLSELPKKMDPKDALRRLMAFGGFPEPFLGNDEREARRWRRERLDRVLRDDVRDLEHVKDIQTLSLFVDQLRSRVGGAVVLSNIAADLQVSPNTLKHWLEALEKMYLVFTVRPFAKNIPRAILKPPKVYFFDNADVLGDEGARFENLVATHLLKRLHFLEDREGHRYELRYIRDKEGREVDFAILKDGLLEEIIEAKWADPSPSSGLRHFAEKLKPKRALQIVGSLKRSVSRGNLWVKDAIEELSIPLN